MNERIKELALQAGLQQRVWNSLGKELPMWQEDPDNPGLDKFAELIVRECAESLWTEECYTSDLALKEFEKNSKKIKQHFGVEE